MDRFEREVRGRLPRRTDREIGIYVRLMEVLNRFADQFDHGQLSSARWTMSYFCSMCEFEFPDQKFYYPYIVRAVCEILNQDLDSAEQTFQMLLDHERRDESAYSGLAHIYYTRREYHAALDSYRRALAICPGDPGATVGMLMNAILCGESIDLDATFRLLDSTDLVHLDDRQSILSIKAIALANAGQSRPALKLVHELIHNQMADEATIIQLARELFQHGAAEDAVQLLHSVESQRESPLILHALATYSMKLNKLAESARVYARLIQRDPGNRQYRFEFGQILLRQGKSAECRTVLRPLLDLAKRSPPKSETEFFLDGFANWICGYPERAEYDFERSGFPPEHHYRNLVP